MFHNITENKHIFSPKGTYAFSRENLDEIIDFLEDMILMTGCPACNSLNTRLVVIDEFRNLICFDCGHAEKLPPPS